MPRPRWAMYLAVALSSSAKGFSFCRSGSPKVAVWSQMDGCVRRMQAAGRQVGWLARHAGRQQHGGRACLRAARRRHPPSHSRTACSNSQASSPLPPISQLSLEGAKRSAMEAHLGGHARAHSHRAAGSSSEGAAVPLRRSRQALGEGAHGSGLHFAWICKGTVAGDAVSAHPAQAATPAPAGSKDKLLTAALGLAVRRTKSGA